MLRKRPYVVGAALNRSESGGPADR